METKSPTNSSAGPIAIMAAIIVFGALTLSILGILGSIGLDKLDGHDAQQINIMQPSGNLESDVPYSGVNEKNAHANLYNAQAEAETTRANAVAAQIFTGIIFGGLAIIAMIVFVGFAGSKMLS